jgi:intraflagellar transport protein 122
VSCDYYLIGGSNKQVLLYSREGVKLGALDDTFDSWVWSCQPHPNGNSVIVATYDGLITSYNVFFGTVHGLYKNRYAYRAGLTDVVVQDLLTEDKFRLKCRDLVKKIAVYKDRLAVLVSEHVIMYESITEEDSGDLTYIVKEKLPYNFQCSLLICCSENIVFCHDKQLRSLSLKGHIEMEWDLSSPVRYLKVLGGLPRKEAMLVALHNGQVLKIFLGNPFPINLCKINGVIRCVDLNMSQTKLAAVDESNVLLVYDLKRSGNLLYQEPNTTSVAWNIYFEDMLCYISKSLLYIKASNYPPQQHKLINGQGLVVGFIGSKIFSLHSNLIITTYVPQSNPMMQYLEQGLYSDSYNVACLGVTQSDWITLSLRSLEGMNLEVAKKGFCRVRDMKYIELINEIQEKWSGNENDKKVHLGEIFAYENKFEEAVKMYCESNRTDKAVELYMELCEFDLAKQLLSEEKKEKKEDVVPSVNVTELVTREANWARSTNDPDRACESYLLARDYKKAIAVMSENRWVQKLINLSVKLTADDADALKLCAHELKRLNEHELAANIYIKLEDYPSLVTLYADTQQWDEGIALVNSNPDLKDLLYLPYGLFLMESDKFEEAQEGSLHISLIHLCLSFKEGWKTKRIT